jgi:hypothetical protein
MATHATGDGTAKRGPDRKSSRSNDAATLTIKDVADACGMFQPLIAQLVPRTWMDSVGWMYTRENLHFAVDLANRLRAERDETRAFSHPYSS